MILGLLLFILFLAWRMLYHVLDGMEFFGSGPPAIKDETGEPEQFIRGTAKNLLLTTDFMSKAFFLSIGVIAFIGWMLYKNLKK